MRISVFIVSLMLLFSSLGWARPQAEIEAAFNAYFKNILFDVRGSRFGAGDVAAGYLTLTDWIQSHHVRGPISILTDDESIRIIKSLSQGQTDFAERTRLYSLTTLPQDVKFDLYLSMANPEGKFRNQIDLNDTDATYRIHLSSDAVSIAQTVFGNTENRSVRQHALVRYHDTDYEMSVPGLGPQEAGVYGDIVARALRPLSAYEVTASVLKQLDLIGDEKTREAVRAVLQTSKLKGADVGVAYGLSAADQKAQFVSYLKGLAERGGQPACVIVPTAFAQQDLHDDELLQKVIFVSNAEAMPDIAERGKIYLVLTKTLPHPVFVGLVARAMKSGLVPVGAGDGFISAAVTLGGPFVLTRVRWNAKNITNFKSRMEILVRERFASSTRLPVLLAELDEIFGQIDLRKAQSLREVSDIFASVSKSVPVLSERLFTNLTLLRDDAPAVTADEMSDPVLAESVRMGGIPKTKATARDSHDPRIIQSGMFMHTVRCEDAAKP